MRAKRTRRRFSREFKLEAIRMALESSRSQVEVARELGINAKVLYRGTREQHADPKQVFLGNGTLEERDRQVEQLQRDNAQLKAELAFLKKVSAYFAKSPR